MSGWNPQVITDLNSPSAQSRKTSLTEAQPLCNFVVLSPVSFLDWLVEEQTILRPECVPGRPDHLKDTRTPWSPANNASIRTEYTTSQGARFRVKQFLYDWARPALDHPCLWGSRASPHPLRNGHVVWTGTDYKGNHGASATIQRTSVELSMEEGFLTDSQIVEFYDSLDVVDKPFAHLLQQEPLARLSYWARHRPGLIEVPVGLWYFRREDPDEQYEWSADPLNLPPKTPFFTLPGGTSFEFDSLGIFHPAQGVESEVIYTSHPDRSREVRAILQYGDRGRVEIKADSHPGCFDQAWEIGSLSINLAYVSPDYGPFEAVITDAKSGIRALLMTSSAVGHTKDWFRNLLTGVRFK